MHIIYNNHINAIILGYISGRLSSVEITAHNVLQYCWAWSSDNCPQSAQKSFYSGSLVWFDLQLSSHCIHKVLL